jgi:phenylacetate-CoA ligase
MRGADGVAGGLPDPFRSVEAMRAHQESALRGLLEAIGSSNAFYGPRLQEAGVDAGAGVSAYLARMPLTARRDWVDDQLAHPPFGTNLTYPVERYARLCRTSGSTGVPMTWLDTPADWAAMLDCWDRVYQAAGVTARSRIFFAFSFGPFLGFWTAFDAASRMGCLCVPGGALSTRARLELIRDCGADVVCCTPTYALRMAAVAAEEGIAMDTLSVRTLVVAGEPGGSVPAVRERIARGWGGAEVMDHHGMTEVGPVSFPCPAEPCVLHVMEDAFLAEVLDPGIDAAVAEGESGELVLTTLRRPGSPLLRYRTGDLVRAERRLPCVCGSVMLRLAGGIRGRVDDMVTVRGVNLFPSAVDAVVRSVPGVVEYQVDFADCDGLQEVSLRVEGGADAGRPELLRREIEHRLRDRFALRIPVTIVEAGSLPRFELKARRWNRSGGVRA